LELFTERHCQKIILFLNHPEDWGSMHLLNGGTHLLIYRASYPRKRILHQHHCESLKSSCIRQYCFLVSSKLHHTSEEQNVLILTWKYFCHKLHGNIKPHIHTILWPQNGYKHLFPVTTWTIIVFKYISSFQQMTLNMTMNYIIVCNFLYLMTSLYYSWTSCPQRLLSVDTEAIKVGHTST